jgi:hypothetical protein
MVEGYGVEHGNYSITMSCQNSTDEIRYFDGKIGCNQTVNGTTWEAGSHVGNSAGDHIYYFEIGGDGVSNIEFNACESEFDTHLRLFKHDLTYEYAECDDCGACGQNSVLDTGGLGPGAYALVIEGYSSDEGVYAVSMQCANSTSELQYFDGTIDCGETVNGTTWEAGSHLGEDAGEHIYYFTVNEPGIANIVFDSCGSEFDTWIKIISHDLTEEFFGCDDCGSCGAAAVIDTGFLAPGEYAVVVEGWASEEGPYTMSMECFADADTVEYFDGPIRCGDTVTGDTTRAGSHRGHESGDHIFYFAVENSSVANLRFDACNSEFDTHLRVYTDNFAEELEECDDCGTCGAQTQLDTGELGPGVYALVVEGYGQSEGIYWVTMNCQNLTLNTSYTYTATDYAWHDITADGSRVEDADWVHDSDPQYGYVASDDGFFVFSMPFTFRYFGYDYTELHVGANGYSTFGHQHFEAGNTQPIPVSGGHADGLFAVYWSDLDPGSGGDGSRTNPGSGDDSGVYVHGTVERVCVSYVRIPYCCGAASPASTFQYLLFPDHAMLFQYQTIEGPSPEYSPLSIGFENHDGTEGVQIAYGWASRPSDGSAFRIQDSSLVEVSCDETLQYMLDGEGGKRTCRDLTQCESFEWQDTPPTPMSDRQCSPHSLCHDGQFESAPPTASSDRLCGSMHSCTAGVQYEVAPATASTDRICQTATTCTNGEFEEISLTDTSDRSCQLPSECSAGQFEIAAPTATSDRRCGSTKACTAAQYEVVPATASSDRVCEAASVCSPEQFAKAPLTSGSDRVCVDATVCDEGVEYESASLLEAVDRECSPLTVCGDDQFEFAAPEPAYDRDCQQLTVCKSAQFEAIAAGPGNDRMCEDTAVCGSTEYEAAPATATGDRHCRERTVCHELEYESAAATETTDRVCTLITVCAPDHTQDIAPTLASDRVCRCRAGTTANFDRADGAVVCHLCAAARFDDDADPTTDCAMCPTGSSSLEGATECTDHGVAVVSGFADVQGAVSPEDFAAALQQMSGPGAAVEIVHYEQTVVDRVTIWGGLPGEYDTATEEGRNNLLTFRAVVADIVGIPISNVAVAGYRRRRLGEGDSVTLELTLHAMEDISAAFSDPDTFVRRLARGLGEDPANLSAQPAVITTAVQHQETLPAPGADHRRATGHAEGSDAAVESLAATLGDPAAVVAALESVVGDGVVGADADAGATAQYSAEAAKVAQLSDILPDSASPDSALATPAVLDFGGLVGSMLAAVTFVCFCMLACFCCARASKQRRLQKTAHGVGATSGLSNAFDTKSSYAGDAGQPQSVELGQTEHNPIQISTGGIYGAARP